MNSTADRQALGLKLIGGFKALCGLLLLALGAGFFHEAHGDLAAISDRIVSALRLDPDNHYVHSAIARVSGLNPSQLKAIGVGTFLYATLYLVEGIGLLIGKHWAEYLTVVATGIFIPLEIYEITRRTSIIRISLLIINSAIVAYLVYQIKAGPRKGPTLDADRPPSSQPFT